MNSIQIFHNPRWKEFVKKRTKTNNNSGMEGDDIHLNQRFFCTFFLNNKSVTLIYLSINERPQMRMGENKRLERKRNVTKTNNESKGRRGSKW